LIKVTLHYIEELKSGHWRWTHVPQGGLMPSRGPKVSSNGQLTLNGNQYTVDPRFHRRTVSPRPGWALGLLILGIMALFGAGTTIDFVLGSVLFGFVGLLCIAIGLLEFQRSFHIYAIFSEGTAMQIPFIRSWIDREKIDEAIGFTSDAIALDAKSQLGREILNPNVPWGMIIMAAIAGLGGGALIGVIVAQFAVK